MRVLLTERDAKAYGVKCDCLGDGELRTLVTVNGAKQYKLECQECGHRGCAIPRNHRLIVGLNGDPPPVDPEIARRRAEARRVHWEGVRSSLDAERERKNQEWWTNYTAYLQTDEWRQRSDRVVARDKRLCQAQLPGCVATATQAHHLTYKHLGNEPLFELIAVCWRCHERITFMDREKRAA